MKTSALPLTLVALSAISLLTAQSAVAQSGSIQVGPVRIFFNGNGLSGRFNNPPPYRPQPAPQPAPKPAPQPAPQAPAIPVHLQGNWVEQFPGGAIWYHTLTADGTHTVTVIPTSGKPQTAVNSARFSNGTLTIDGNAFAASPNPGGGVQLSLAGGQPRIWTRKVRANPDPAPSPSVQVNLPGTWYEQTKGSDGSPVLFQYDLNEDGSYDMFKYAQNRSGDWDLDQPFAHLADFAAADIRLWSYAGNRLTLGQGQRFAEGPMQIAGDDENVKLTSSLGERTWSRNP